MKSPFDYRRKLVRTKYEREPEFYWWWKVVKRIEWFVCEMAEAADWRNR